MKKICTLIISVLLMFNIVQAVQKNYSDVPANSWATEYIYRAQNYGLMEGISDNEFGFSANMKKSEFLTVLVKMFKWKMVYPDKESFTDVSNSAWYYPYIETALFHNVIDKTLSFEPNKNITREEMAIMLVRALGYRDIAEKFNNLKLKFIDVENNKGYISIAYDISMTKGTSENTFSPLSEAKREEVATMMVNIYERYTKPIEWVHGFYAFSSYNGRYVTDEMSAVSVGWSRLSINNNNEIYLNTGSEKNNNWKIPSAYEDIVEYLKNNGTELKLNVYMDMSETVMLDDGTTVSGLKNILINKNLRRQAVQCIISELTKEYDKISVNPYSGVTIDFEGLKGEELKEGFNEFLLELDKELEKIDKTLYVAVQPAIYNSAYYDGFDYKTIGEIADKVILMAHDYNATSLKGFEESTYYKTTALTPVENLYYSLKMITDDKTGIEDKNKIVLAISFASIGFKINNEGKLIDGNPVAPAVSTIYNRLKNNDTVMGYSDIYQNPYITYTTENNENIFLWYEDSRSVLTKIKLAKMFDINGLSIWRIGNIPDYNDEGIYYDVFSTIKDEM